MSFSQRWLRIIAVLAVTVIALAVRLRAVERMPIDYDEDDYLRAGQQYATGIARGDWSVLTRENYRTEHPPLTKIATGLALALLPSAPEIPDLPTTAPPATSLPQPHLAVARLLQAAYGTLEVLALAVFNPLAALFLAIHTWQIQYTTEVMLEALPSLTSLLCVLYYLRSKGKWNGWLLLSAVTLGLTMAGKYPYVFAGAAVAVHWLWTTYPRETPRLWAWRNRTTLARWLSPVVLWGLVALVIFFAADPYLWPDPIHRLKESVLYHGGYAQSEHVREANLPFWQPIVYLFMSGYWRPDIYFVMLDVFIAFFAFLGLPRLWQKQRVFALWLLMVLVFLLLWPTKWPQYILMLTAPLCLAAAEGFRARIWEPLTVGRPKGIQRQIPTTHGWQDVRRALPWLLPGLISLSIIMVYPMLYQGAMALTDFNLLSIRDGMTGGVWRAAWQGVTSQVKPVEVELFPSGGQPGANQVHYAGLALLGQLFSGVAASVMVFNLMWTVLVVSLQTALGVAVAIVLNRRGVRLKGWWQALFILPLAFPEFVGALTWSSITDPTNGWLSLALHKSIEWSKGPDTTLLVLLVAATWIGWPFMMVAATAGLKMIPPDAYDAAAMDGADRWQQFRAITWPMLLPLLAPALILRSIAAFNQFYLFYVMPTPSGVITFATLSYFFFDSTSSFGGQFAVSAVLNLFTVLVLLLLILWFNRWSKAAEGVTYA